MLRCIKQGTFVARETAQICADVANAITIRLRYGPLYQVQESGDSFTVSPLDGCILNNYGGSVHFSWYSDASACFDAISNNIANELPFIGCDFLGASLDRYCARDYSGMCVNYHYRVHLNGAVCSDPSAGAGL